MRPSVFQRYIFFLQVKVNLWGDPCHPVNILFPSDFSIYSLSLTDLTILGRVGVYRLMIFSPTIPSTYIIRWYSFERKAFLFPLFYHSYFYSVTSNYTMNALNAPNVPNWVNGSLLQTDSSVILTSHDIKQFLPF